MALELLRRLYIELNDHPRGSRLRLWIVDCGLWIVDCGLWIVGVLQRTDVADFWTYTGVALESQVPMASPSYFGVC